MGKWIDTIKALFVGIKPAKDVIASVEAGKNSGWKTPLFWATLLGSLSAFVLAIKAVIPAVAGAVAIAVLIGLYNIVRAYINAQQEGVAAPLGSTRFWTTVVGVVLVALTDVQTAGVGGKLVTTLIGFLTAIGTAAQSVGAKEPSDQESRPQ